MAEHDIIKPEKLAATAAAALSDNLVIPNLFYKEGIEQFKGAKDDTVNITVPGVLPYRSYGWRNNRSAPIQFDEYAERKIAISFGGDAYSAVHLTDEQATMDFAGWSKLVVKQGEAIATGLNYEAVEAVDDAPYEVEVVLSSADLKGSLIKLRTIFNRLRVTGTRTILCGSDLEAALLADDKLNLASSVGDAEAETAIREATMGRRLGFNFVGANELGATTGVAMTDNAFIFVNGSPSVPQSIKVGGVGTVDNVSVRFIQDYDTNYQRDRSVVTTYKGFRYVDDPLVGRIGGSNNTFISDDNHFVRAVKVTLGGAFSVEVDNNELSDITGINSTDGIDDGA